MIKTKNKYEITKEQKESLETFIDNVKPTRRNTLIALVEDLMPKIDKARSSGVQWEDIADGFNRILKFDDPKEKINGNTLSQAYVNVKKRVNEVRVSNKKTYEDLEQALVKLEAENAKLKKELEKSQKQKEKEKEKEIPQEKKIS